MIDDLACDPLNLTFFNTELDRERARAQRAIYCRVAPKYEERIAERSGTVQTANRGVLMPTTPCSNLSIPCKRRTFYRREAISRLDRRINSLPHPAQKFLEHHRCAVGHRPIVIRRARSDYGALRAARKLTHLAYSHIG